MSACAYHWRRLLKALDTQKDGDSSALVHRRFMYRRGYHNTSDVVSFQTMITQTPTIGAVVKKMASVTPPDSGCMGSKSETRMIANAKKVLGLPPWSATTDLLSRERRHNKYHALTVSRQCQVCFRPLSTIRGILATTTKTSTASSTGNNT